MAGTSNGTPPKKKKSERSRRPDQLIWIAFFALFAYFVWQFTLAARMKEIAYSEFQRMVASGQVGKVEVAEDIIRFTDKANPPKVFYTTPIKSAELEKSLTGKGFEYKAIPSSRWGTEIIFSWVVPILLVVAIWYFISRRMSGMGDQVMKFSKSKARRITSDHPRFTFRDVAGVDEAKEELMEIIDFLKDPAKYQRLGGKIPKGVLLVGPPGTGKTLLARAVAGEAGVPFFSMSGSDFVEMFVGVGAARVRDLFEQSKKQAPCIIFIDELDAVGRYRGAGLGGGHDEREQTLNQLLVEMDGFESRKGVIILAATNRPDVLDPALLRPGRFDRQVVIDAPDLRGRNEILGVHAREVPMAPEVDLGKTAQRTPGFTGADLANVVNEAALLAARRNKDRVETPDLDEAVERVIAGPQRKSKVISPREKQVIAYHEGGHALVAMSLPGTDPVHKISIVPRGVGALGYTLQLPVEDRYITTQDQLENRIAALLGGRAAEKLVFGQLSTGAHNDLEKVSHLARRMVCEFGMSDALGAITYGRKEGQVFLGKDLVQEKNYSDHTAERIDEEVSLVVSHALDIACKILTERRHDLDAIANRLLEREVITGEEITVLLGGVSPAKAAPIQSAERARAAS